MRVVIETLSPSREAHEGNKFYREINKTGREGPDLVVLTSLRGLEFPDNFRS